MESLAVTLGPFKMEKLLFEGGMGEIWRGVNRHQNRQVAIKVVTSKHSRKAKYLDSFQNEVSTMTRLYHPGVVMILDLGTLPREVHKLSRGALQAGSPYFVMEYVSGGSLLNLVSPLPWQKLREVLTSILGVLAHIHSRGVIHRDLKPANVLLSGPSDLRPGLKLIDFGLALTLEHTGETPFSKSVMGTPSYMAPEQFYGSWRDHGPCTDLYSFGCMAYQLSTGSIPFQGEDYDRLAQAHMYAQPEAFPGGLNLPPGFESWVSRLLEKSPRRRFRRAADALAILLDFDQTSYSFSDTPNLSETRGQTDSPLQKQLFTFDTLPLKALAARSRLESSSEPVADLCPLPNVPVPQDWVREEGPSIDIELSGASLALFRLRTFPLVNRTSEVAAIWSAICRVSITALPELVLLRGPSGCGLSRLADWVCQRSHELGAAELFRAEHRQSESNRGGLTEMIARKTKCLTLSPNEVQNQLRWILGEAGDQQDIDLAELSDFLAPNPATPQQVDQTTRLASPRRRYALMIQLMLKIALNRPVIILTLEDIQWCLDSLLFTAYLLQTKHPKPTPIVILATVRDEVLADLADERDLLKKMATLERATTLEIPPLSPDHHRSLIRNLLYLSEETAEKIQALSECNPKKAIQLIAEWAKSGALQMSPNGFELKPT